MKFSSSLWRNHTRTARLLTCAAVTTLLMTGCASDQRNTSRQADGVPAVLGSEQPSASPTATPTSDEDANTDSNQTTDENSQADQASPEATPSEIDSESIEPTDNRVASWVSYKTRICVTNTTSANIALEWDPNMQNGKSEYLKPSELKKTLGPSAFDCAVSYATFNGEFGDFTIEGKALETENDGGRDIYFSFPGEPVLRVRSDKFAVLTWADEANPGRTLKARASTTDELEQYDQIQVYPIEIRISETRTSSG